MKKRITLNKSDYQYVKENIVKNGVDDASLIECYKLLEKELERAQIVSDEELPSRVVGIDSKVDIEIKGKEKRALTIVRGIRSDLKSNSISVFSAVGSAILGYAESDTIEWPFRKGKESIIIKKVY
jgi:regulator of nucleoside diphosphate kinase